MATDRKKPTPKKKAAKKRRLTEGEQRCLEAFGSLVEENQKNPTVREVSGRLKLSAMGAQAPLNKLVEKGYLQNEWGWTVIGKELTDDGREWVAFLKKQR